MYRFLLAAAPLLLLSVQVPTQASASSNDNKVGKKCEPKKKKSGGMFGSIAGSIAGSALGRAGVPSSVVGVSIPVGSLLSDAIISKLNCKEQVQAATATTEATRGGVGTSSAWTSDSRPGVSGSSTVVAQNARSDGGSCMTVTDVVIVDGEETTVDKQMCRSPGGGNYVVAV
jgi:surface antigen